MQSSEKNVSSFETSSTGTCLSQNKKYFLSLINPHNLGQYRLLNLMERNGYFGSNNLEANRNETKMDNIYVKKYKNNKIGLKYKENEDASFNSDKDNIFLNHNLKQENYFSNNNQKNEYVRAEINDNMKNKRMNNSLESRQLINNLLRNQKNKIKEIKSRINDNLSGISFSSSSSFENNNKQFCTPSSSNSIELNCNNQYDNSQDWITKQIYVEYNNNYNEDRFNNNNYNNYKKYNNYSNYNNNNYNNEFHIDNSINEINNTYKNVNNQFDNNFLYNNNNINNYYNSYKVNDNNFSYDNFNLNFEKINENKNKEEEKEKNEINKRKKDIKINSPMTNNENKNNENKIENINVKINSFEKRKVSRSPLRMADVFMINKKSFNPNLNKNEYRESIAFNNKNIKKIIFIKKSEPKIKKEEKNNDIIKVSIKKDKDEINEERKEVEKNEIKSPKEKEQKKSEIELGKVYQRKNSKGNIRINKKIKENNEMKEKIDAANNKENINRIYSNKDKIIKEKENVKDKELDMKNKIIKKFNDNIENKEDKEIKKEENKEIKNIKDINKENKGIKEVNNKDNKKNEEINKENIEIKKINKEIKEINKENKKNEEINKEKKELRLLENIINKNNNNNINSINRHSRVSQNKDESILGKNNTEISNKINNISATKEIKRNTPLRDYHNNIKYISNKEIINEKNNLMSSFKAINNLNYDKKEFGKRTTPSIRRRFKDSKSKISSYNNLSPVVDNKNNNQQNINNRSLKRIVSIENMKEKDSVTVNINRINVEENNKSIINKNKDKKELLIEKSINNTKIIKYSRNKDKEEEEEKKKDKEDRNNEKDEEEDDDINDIDLNKYHCESEKEERIKRRRKLYKKEDNKEDKNSTKNLNKKNINTFSFENLFYVKYNKNRKEEEDNVYEKNNLSSFNNNRRNQIKERNRKYKKEEEIKKNEEENNNKKKEDINNKIENTKIIKSPKINENNRKKKRIKISENVLVEEINTTKPVVKINISEMLLKKKVNKNDNNQINNLQVNKRQNIIKNNHNKIEKMNKNIYLFGFDQNNNFLQFDLRKKKYKKRKISELEDLSDIFEQEYTYQNTLLYNTLIGSFILTGKDCNILFYYNSINETIIKLCEFKHSHHLGCLLLDQENNKILILGGKTNMCESFSFESEEIKEIPSLNFDRATASYIISKDRIYGFFGFSFKKGKYIYNIEYINKNILDKWEVIDLNFDCKEEELSFHLRNISTFNYENDQNKIIIYGGKQGRNEKIIDGYYYLYDVDKNKFEKMEGLYYNIIKDLKFINIWKNSELIDLEEKKGFFFDRQRQIVELPDEDKIIDGHNIYTSIIIDSENNVHYLTNNHKYITVYKYVTK